MDGTNTKNLAWLLDSAGRWNIPRVMVVAQGHLFKLCVGHTAFKGGGGTREEIVAFSAASRKRMLETLARVSTAKAGFMCFVTLTYPDRQGPPSLKEAERDRQSFLKRVKRRFSETSAIWRREWEERKSGAFDGALFPHYHLLFFNLPFVHYTEVNKLWGEVLGFDGYLRTEIQALKSWRQALYYVSKYMAKVEKARNVVGASTEVEAADAEERPEGATTGPGADTGGLPRSLVYGTYLTAGEEGKEENGAGRSSSMGRFWGIFNRSRFPWADCKSVRLKAGTRLDDAKALAGQEWSGVYNYPGYGFSLFVDDSQQWLRAICALQEDSENGFDEEGEYDVLPS